MPQELSSEVHEQIYRNLQSTFSDFPLFNSLVAVKLKQAIVESNTIDINIKTTRKVAERYFSTDAFKTPEQKNVLAQIQIIFKTCYTLILSHYDLSKAMLWDDVNLLLSEYPQFVGQDAEELQYLLNFRNYMKVALIIIPARLNKQCLLKICARLEGSQNEYVTGGGQKPCVTRRVDIYEREGGVSAEKRPDRPAPALNTNQQTLFTTDAPSSNGGGSGKRKKESVGPAYCSMSTIKQSRITRLPSDDIRELLHHSDHHQHGIPALYQTQEQRQGSAREVVDSLQALLDLRHTSSEGGSGGGGYNGSGGGYGVPSSSSSADYFDSVPMVPMPGMFRGETDMLIASCGLLSSASDLWGEELGVKREDIADSIVTVSRSNNSNNNAASSSSHCSSGGNGGTVDGVGVKNSASLRAVDANDKADDRSILIVQPSSIHNNSVLSASIACDVAVSGDGGDGSGASYMHSTEGGDLWKDSGEGGGDQQSSSSLSLTRPEYISRSITLDIFNGSITEDLKALYGSGAGGGSLTEDLKGLYGSSSSA